MLGIPQPKEMTGHDLRVGFDEVAVWAGKFNHAWHRK